MKHPWNQFINASFLMITMYYDALSEPSTLVIKYDFRCIA